LSRNMFIFENCIAQESLAAANMPHMYRIGSILVLRLKRN